MTLSCVSGTSTEPLIGETIGDNLDRVATTHPDNLCLVSRHQAIRWTYTDLPALRTVIALGPGGDVAWDDFLDQQVSMDAVRNVQSLLQFDDPINIQYTSGTTGNPKGATLTHNNILNNGYLVTELQGLEAGSVLCVPVPLYHCFGMVMGNLGMLSRGGAVVYPAEGFEPAATLAAVSEERCESISGVPTMFIAMLDDPSFTDADMTSLRTGVMAGSPCPVEVMKRVVSDMHMDDVEIACGMTETSPVSFQSRTDDPMERRVSTVGRIMPHTECKIVNPATGRVVDRDETGELCTRGYPVMLGYWDNPEASAEAIDRACWMHTGDLATMDDEGYVGIVGRIKDMVIRGGENIYPREVEEFLYGHRSIVEVQVVGVPDAKYGEELCAWVRVREGESLTIEELRVFCQGKIAHYKVPRYLRITDEFPLTVTGKDRKVEMREMSIAELDLGQVASTQMA